MIACISPLPTSRLRPLRISLPSISACKFSIFSIDPLPSSGKTLLLQLASIIAQTSSRGRRNKNRNFSYNYAELACLSELITTAQLQERLLKAIPGGRPRELVCNSCRDLDDPPTENRSR